MPVDALLLALLAAAVHAGWNLVLAGTEDPEAAAPVALAVGAVVLVPFAVVLWDVDARAWPYIAASVVFELAYFVLLARAYARVDLAFVYPIARGSAPVLVIAGSVALLGVRPSAAELAGIVLVVAGIVLVRGPVRASGHADLVLALAVGACIAAYTVIDDRGIEHAASIPYLACVMVPAAAGMLLLRGRATPARVDPRTAAAGVGMVGAYALTLAALALAEPGPVAAVRETGIVMAVAFTAVAGRERVTPARLAGAALVAAGVAALALS